MSVLSSPQGTPERVWSLVAGLASLGGRADRATFDSLINPGYEKDGAELRAKGTLAGDALGAASSLGLIDAGREKATLSIEPPSGYLPDFADHVHDRLSSLQPDHVDAPILDAYAWVAAESDRVGGLSWIYEMSQRDFADVANAGLVGEDEAGKPMNPTKVVPWRRWLAFIGLGMPLPLGQVPDFPTPSARLTRELERMGLEPDTVLSADQFIATLAGRMPYLDRGRLFTQACQRIGHSQSARRLSPLMSIALRDLHDEGTIRLHVSGDAADRLRLTEDSAHAFDAFTSVTLFPGQSA